MNEPRPLASGMVDLIAGALREELGRARKPGDVDAEALARRLTIELLDHLEVCGVLFGRRHGPPGPPPPPPPGPGDEPRPRTRR